MADIVSQNAQYDGVTIGVQFTNGRGQTDDAKKIEWFQEHGYTVENNAMGTPLTSSVSDTEFAAETNAVNAVNFAEANATATQEGIAQANSLEGAEVNDTEFANEMGAAYSTEQSTPTNAEAQATNTVREKTTRTKK